MIDPIQNKIETGRPTDRIVIQSSVVGGFDVIEPSSTEITQSSGIAEGVGNRQESRSRAERQHLRKIGDPRLDDISDNRKLTEDISEKTECESK